MEPFPTKSVIIHRDEDGFGLRVGGQNPVFVDCVHENGAAWKAGVRKNDRIIKVNGTLVRSYDHQRVVQMIQNCTPFVNLTLHSPGPMIVDPFSADQISVNSNVVKGGAGHHLSISNSNLTSGNHVVPSTMQIHPLHQHPHHHHPHHPHHPHAHLHNQRRHYTHPHSMSSNLNWLLDISDDLFQDSQQQQQQQQQNQEQQQPPPQAINHEVGVSKLVVSGPNPLVSSSKLDHKRQMQQHVNNIGDNPYYYYKTAPEKSSETTSCNSSTTSLLSSQQEQQASSKVMVRSRSSTKMSTRSTGGKYKARNLRSRLVDDLKSLAITNQATPASLSTSPSSSDLSDCDDVNPTRLDFMTLSNSPKSASCLPNATNIVKSKNTTRRFEIIRELVDTEKTHTEKLKQLNDLLYKPIKAENLIPPDQLKMVFSCHKTLFKIHRQIYKKLVAAQMNISEYHQEPLVGKALVEIFDGELGRRLEEAASLFCACQSTNTDVLNRITRKDTKSGEFLAQVANQQMLGRLGIKDLLASCFQRLTKYPLLLDNLLKATPHAGSSGMIHSKSLSEGAIAICQPTGLNGNNDLGNNNTIMTVSDEGQSIRGSKQQEAEVAEESRDDQAPRSSTTSTLNMVDPPSIPEQPTTVNDKNNEDEPDEKSNYETVTTTTPETPTSEVTPTTDTATTTSTNNASQTDCSSALSDEYAHERVCIDRALHLSRQILIHVNEAVSRAIAQSKLKEVWKKTDKNPALPVIDIETQQLLHEGSLTLRLAHRSFEVYVILLTHYLIILTREGQDKYKLKYFTDGKSTTQFSPIFNIDEHLVTRDSATDENGFYLLSKRKDDERMYEFASQSPAERAKWKEKIHLAQLYNFAAVPNDDNTLTRYRELISLATSSNTPNNIEHSPTNNNIVAAYSSQ